MKSKIEKLNIFVDELSGKNCVKVLGIVKKVDEIIDRLNEQPEEKIEYFDKGDKVRTYKSLEVSEKAYSEEPTVEDVYIEDTSEEWVKEFKFSYGHLYIQNEDGEFCKINGEVEDMIDFIRQLLEERVENVLEQIQDWLSSDKGGDMDDEYLNILIDDIEELKLNTKKK